MTAVLTLLATTFFRNAAVQFFYALAEGRRPFTGYAEGTLLTDYAIGAWFHKIAIEAGLGRGSHQLPPQPRT